MNKLRNEATLISEGLKNELGLDVDAMQKVRFKLLPSKLHLVAVLLALLFNLLQLMKRMRLRTPWWCQVLQKTRMC